MIEIQPYTGRPDKERLIAAMRGQEVDRVPNFEVLIEDQHVERLLGRKAGNTLAVGGDPAKGIEEAQDARPMYPEDYIELCGLIGQDAIVIEALWTPFKKIKNGKLVTVGDRSVKTREDFEKAYGTDKPLSYFLHFQLFLWKSTFFLDRFFSRTDQGDFLSPLASPSS